MPLYKIRRQIDRVDSRIVKLLNDRMELALTAKKFKTQVEDREREAEVLSRIRGNATDLVSAGFLEKIYLEIIHESRDLQQRDANLFASRVKYGVCDDRRERHEMMKQVWVKADPWEKELVTVALESGADAVIVPEERVEDARELGVIKTVAAAGDVKWGRDVVYCDLRSSEDEEEIVRMGREKIVVVRTSDWRVIPLENLVSKTGNVFVEVEDLHEARMASGILERGVDGIVVVHRDPAVVREIVGRMKGISGLLELSGFSIQEVRPVGMGDRVCVDTCTLMSAGEGMLVGNSTQALFLVQAESIENPYAALRPFRVNAGPVHAYALVPEGMTRYLSEIRSGDPVLGVNWKGESRPLVVGRAKVERRPLVLVTAQGTSGDAAIILQNAETIRLVRPGGEAVSVVSLKPGDEVLGHAESPGRHFGHKIQETIIER